MEELDMHEESEEQNYNMWVLIEHNYNMWVLVLYTAVHHQQESDEQMNIWV